MAKRLKKLNHPQRKKKKRVVRKTISTVENNPIEPGFEIPEASSQGSKEAQADALPPETTVEMEAKFYTAKDAADMLSVSAKQMTAFIQNKSLPNAQKKSGRWRIPETDILALKKKLQEQQN